jgi:hypothetical protein
MLDSLLGASTVPRRGEPGKGLHEFDELGVRCW